ncbi:MAG: OmpA family protein [Myxococcota bacterium]|nr:OmpA family protein [Myxococcota bacterium]
MKIPKKLLLGAAATALVWGCATAVPPELIDARLAYQRASAGPAREEASQYLLEAERALQRADQAYQSNPGSEAARDLAYVAKRRVEIAESRARQQIATREAGEARTRLSAYQNRSVEELAQVRAKLAEHEAQLAERQQQAAERARQEQEAQTQAEKDRLAAERVAQEQQLATAQEELRRRTEELAAREQELEQERQAREAERIAREEAEARAQEALASLEQIADVKQEARGTVITLPGSLLFASGKANLGQEAMRRLNKVADALKQAEGQKLKIEGHSDALGADDYNQQLSYLRALAVRDYLVSRGLAPDRVEAEGFGEQKPIASNTSSEGRATNRRVEIVVESAQGVGGGGEEQD